jgi:hypothetical protein
MTPRQMRQLDRLRVKINGDPYLTQEDKSKILLDFESGFSPPIPAEEINGYLNLHNFPLPATTNDTRRYAIEAFAAVVARDREL